MRWKSLLTCCKASMCSTAQSPRARKAFSRACAARTCPAPDVADSNNTRGFVFICPEILRMQEASRCFALARGDFFQDPTSDFLKFPESGEIVLKIVVQELRVLRAELRSQNHVTQSWRRSDTWIPPAEPFHSYCTQLLPHEGSQAKNGGRNPTRHSPRRA